MKSRAVLLLAGVALGFAAGIWAGRLTMSDVTPEFAIVNEWMSPVETLPIGATAPDFGLEGVDGRRHHLSDFSDSPALAVVFTCNHCPTAQAYESRLIGLAREYGPRGVAFVAISPNDPESLRPDEMGYTDVGDRLDDMRIRAEEQDFPFPYLYDGDDQSASRAYGPVATPHLFLFDRDRRLRYAGRIDDADDPRRARRHDARNAIEALLAGQDIPTETTRAFGCSIKWANESTSVADAESAWRTLPVEIAPVDAVDAAALARNAGEDWLLLNLWASWCAPCVAELPALAEMDRMYGHRGLSIATISVDDPKEIETAFGLLRDLHVPLNNYIFDGGDRDALAEAVDPAWPGSLPHTILVAPGGRVVYRVPGAFDPLRLRQAIVEQLGRTYF